MKIKTIQSFKIPEGIRVPYLSGRLYSLLSNEERKAVKKISLNSIGLNYEKREKKIIVSMTSFPARIYSVGYAIITLMNQTMKPDRIILWLAKEQFQDVEIPEILRKLEEHGLEIKYCDDLKAHKKYHYALKMQKPDELIITYDDDLIYPEDSIERLYKTYLMHPDCIICNRAGCCSGGNKKFAPYGSWRINSPIGVSAPSSLLFPSTGGGTLYPYGTVNEKAFDVKKMSALALTADDLWMRFMSALNKTMVIKTRRNHRTFSTLEGSQEESLQIVNCLGGENDRVLERLSAEYPEAAEFILGDMK